MIESKSRDLGDIMRSIALEWQFGWCSKYDQQAREHVDLIRIADCLNRQRSGDIDEG